MPPSAQCRAGGGKAKGARVELTDATARKFISHSRKDGLQASSFTQHWCEAVTRHLEVRKTFTCDDIIKDMSLDSELEQFPSTFVLREGCDLSITFRRLHPQGPIEPTLP